LDETYIRVNGRWRYLYRAIYRDGNLLESMLSKHRNKDVARRFLRQLLGSTNRRPLRNTTDKHPAYAKAIRRIIGRRVLHRTNQYLNNRTEQSHRPIKQRYYPMLGFKCFESASRFCTAFDELRNYLRVKPDSNDPGSVVADRVQFITRWNTLINELVA
jgi:putative transposase